MNDRNGSKGVLERSLSVFTDVRAGEGPLVLLMAFNVFLLLTSYYLIKPVREALILADGGAEVKSYLVAGMAFVLFFIVGWYAKLVARYERTQLISVVTGAFIACLVVFWALSRASVPYLGYAFFIWVGIFSVMVVAQFWSYANDVYDNDAGKRLFPLVAFGGSFGAFAGSWIADQMLEVFGVFEMLLWAGGVLAICIVLTNIISRRVWGKAALEARRREMAAKDDPGVEKRKEGYGFDLLVKHRYLGYIAILVLLLNLVNTTGEYILGKLVEVDADEQVELAVDTAVTASEGLKFHDRELGDPTDPENQQSYRRSHIGSFYSGFFLWVNLLGMFMQLFVVSRLIKYGGVKAGLLWLPIIALGTYAVIFFVPMLRAARIGKTFENASDYSINKTTLQMLFLPTSRDIKYKAKQAIDSFFHRFGDVVSALLVFVGTSIFAFGPRGFALVNLGIILVWLVIVIQIVREHKAIENGERPEITGEREPETVAV